MTSHDFKSNSSLNTQKNSSSKKESMLIYGKKSDVGKKEFLEKNLLKLLL